MEFGTYILSYSGGNPTATNKCCGGGGQWLGAEALHGVEQLQYAGILEQSSWIIAAQLIAQSDAMHTTLQSHGYNYINIDAGCIGLNGAATVRDLWSHTDLGTFNTGYSSTNLASHA